MNMTQVDHFLFYRVEKSGEKGKEAGYQYSLFFHIVF